MQRRKFSREFKLEAVKLVPKLGVLVSRAARDLDLLESKRDVFDYIERFYSLTRRHSTLGYLSP